MATCFVTQLKESVNNNLLPELGFLKVSFPVGYTRTFTFNGKKSAKLYNTEGTLKATASGSTIAPDGTYAGYLLVEPQSSMTRFGATGADANNIVHLIGIKAASLSACSITMFSVYFSDFRDSIANIVKYLPSLTELNMRGCLSVYGNLEDMLNNGALAMQALSYFNVEGCVNVKAKRSTITALSGLISTFLYNGIEIDEDN